MNNIITIVIAAYNVEKYIEECIESILKNKSPSFNLQIIVVDDGSTDNTFNIVHEKYSEDVTLLTKSNGGQSSARNLALEHANGDYLMFLDADDLLVNNALQKCLDVFYNFNVDMVLFDAKEFYSDFKEIDYKVNTYLRPDDVYSKVISTKNYFETCIASMKYNVSPCMYIFKRDCLNEIKFLEGVIYEDNLFTTNLILNSNVENVFCLEDNLYLRRLRADSTVTEIKSIKHFNSYLKIFEHLCRNAVLFNENKFYRVFCGNILALAAKLIPDIVKISFWDRFKLKVIIVSNLIKHPRSFRFRVLGALFLGRVYKFIAYYIKSRRFQQ